MSFFSPRTLADGALYRVFYKFSSSVLQVWIFAFRTLTSMGDLDLLDIAQNVYSEQLIQVNARKCFQGFRTYTADMKS